jgi:two-component system alkaline phosphatase synthesis response regulator PhoP
VTAEQGGARGAPAAPAAAVLLVEDEADLAFLIGRNLEQQGYAVTTCPTVAAARAALDRGAPDLLLLDVNLPDGTGFELLRGLRAAQVFTPALFLTARTDEADRLMGFAVGGDDYVCKPFSMAELAARVGAIVRRARQAGRASYQGPTFRADFERFRLTRLDTGEEHVLTYLEAEVLRYLTARPNVPVSRNDLLNDVWGHDRYPTTRTIDTHMLNLRKKLELDPQRPRHLLTVHGTGYKFVP